MRKLLCFIAILVMATGFFACNSVEEPGAQGNSARPKVRVGKLSDYITDVSRGDDDTQILIFDQVKDFEETVAMLKAMSHEQRLAYFDSIGFDGAYTFLSRADDQLEAIFDDESLDSCAFCHKILEYKNKFSGILTFRENGETENEQDSIDVTPYLPFIDDNNELVGSILGYVVVEDELVGPLGAQESTSRASGPTETNTAIIVTKQICINHGKYKSELAVGRIGHMFGFRVQTYRKKFLHTKYDNRCIHHANLYISDVKGNWVNANISHKTGQYDLRPYAVRLFDLYVDIKITDFYDSYHPKEKMSKTFTKVVMK